VTVNETKTLDYYATEFITALRSFRTQAPEKAGKRQRVSVTKKKVL